MSGRFPVCRVTELLVGQARGLDPRNQGVDTVVALHALAGFRAFRNTCPHQGARLEYRKDRFLSADGTRVICHAHGAQFDADTGECVHGACLGQALQSVPCLVEEGWVWVVDA